MSYNTINSQRLGEAQNSIKIAQDLIQKTKGNKLDSITKELIKKNIDEAMRKLGKNDTEQVNALKKTYDSLYNGTSTEEIQNDLIKANKKINTKTNMLNEADEKNTSVVSSLLTYLNSISIDKVNNKKNTGTGKTSLLGHIGATITASDVTNKAKSGEKTTTAPKVFLFVAGHMGDSISKKTSERITPKNWKNTETEEGYTYTGKYTDITLDIQPSTVDKVEQHCKTKSGADDGTKKWAKNLADDVIENIKETKTITNYTYSFGGIPAKIFQDALLEIEEIQNVIQKHLVISSAITGVDNWRETIYRSIDTGWDVSMEYSTKGIGYDDQGNAISYTKDGSKNAADVDMRTANMAKENVEVITGQFQGEIHEKNNTSNYVNVINKDNGETIVIEIYKNNSKTDTLEFPKYENMENQIVEYENKKYGLCEKEIKIFENKDGKTYTVVEFKNESHDGMQEMGLKDYNDRLK